MTNCVLIPLVVAIVLLLSAAHVHDHHRREAKRKGLT